MNASQGSLVALWYDTSVEAFEQFCAVAMEAEGLVVSAGVKFPVKRQVRKASRAETQVHGYEVDLVGARADKLVLATVKSFFGSRGVQARHVTDEGGRGDAGAYRLLNDNVITEGVIQGAMNRYGYRREQIRMRFYVGKFSGTKKGTDEQAIREWCANQIIGGGPVELVGLTDVIDSVRRVAASKTYLNNPVIVAMKVLAFANMLDLDATPEVDEAAVDAMGNGG